MTGEGGIRKIVLDEDAAGYALAQDILGRLPGVPVERGPGKAVPPRSLRHPSGKEGMQHSPFDLFRKDQRLSLGKDTLHLLRYAGEFLKPCPGTRNYICCGYQILNLAANCPMDCSYCILQAYFNQPNLRIYVNYHEELQNILKQIDLNPDRIYRVGTGEFTDSLALDHVTSWTQVLLPEFSMRRNAVLELKTKTDRIKGVLSTRCRDRIVLSWSLNSHLVASREEHGSATLRRRLDAARSCQQEGFVLGFHFDPMIPHVNWREGYLRTLEQLDAFIDPKRVIWISLGAFRFMPGLKRTIRARPGKTLVLDGEFVTGLDGKMRYFKPIRIELYRFLRENLDKWHPDLGIYLCMESDDVWTRSMGWSPKDTSGLAGFLDSRVNKLFGPSFPAGHMAIGCGNQISMPPQKSPKPSPRRKPGSRGL